MQLRMFVVAIAVVTVCLACQTCHCRRFDHKIRLPTTRPLNIAHRGSSGTHPEHTLEAYRQAIRDGADVIECDLQLTRDLELVCLHDVTLLRNTDVARHNEFSRRKRNVVLPEKGSTLDWFTFDFTLAELKTLRVYQTETVRDPKYNGLFQISTFDEYVDVAKNASRPVGIYPELKMPSFLNSLPMMRNTTRMEDLLLSALERHGFKQSDDPCFIQSFEEDSLDYLVDKTPLPLVMLVYRESHVYDGNRETSKLGEWGKKFYGIGAWKTQVANYHDYTRAYKNWISGTTDLVRDARAAGLKVHLYTFRNEDEYLAWDFGQNPLEEYQYFMQFDIDGYFTDFPRTFESCLDFVYGGEGKNSGVLWRMDLVLISVMLMFGILS